jgi:hypothetical protein
VFIAAATAASPTGATASAATAHQRDDFVTKPTCPHLVPVVFQQPQSAFAPVHADVHQLVVRHAELRERQAWQVICSASAGRPAATNTIAASGSSNSSTAATVATEGTAATAASPATLTTAATCGGTTVIIIRGVTTRVCRRGGY